MEHPGCVFVAGIHPSRTWMCLFWVWVCAMECTCAQTRPRFILSSERVWEGGGGKSPINSKGKIPSSGGSGGLNPRRCITQDSEPNTLPIEIFRPKATLKQSNPATPGMAKSVLLAAWPGVSILSGWNSKFDLQLQWCQRGREKEMGQRLVLGYGRAGGKVRRGRGGGRWGERVG